MMSCTGHLVRLKLMQTAFLVSILLQALSVYSDMFFSNKDGNKQNTYNSNSGVQKSLG